MLINCMLIHVHNPEDLLASVIASIPTNLRSRLNTSDNYRGISLCCSLCNVTGLDAIYCLTCILMI